VFCTKSSSLDSEETKTVNVTFIEASTNKESVIAAHVGSTVLETAHKNAIDLEGACEASLACSTCHVVLDKESYDKLPEPSDEENDMLDLAFGLKETSRLGCQIKLTPELEGMKLTVPSATRNFAVDGYKPKPH